MKDTKDRKDRKMKCPLEAGTFRGLFYIAGKMLSIAAYCFERISSKRKYAFEG